METQLIKIVRIFAGLIFTLSGALGIFLGILAIIDPVGTKMSDDADPFGVPPSLSESLTVTIIFILVFTFGFLVISGFNPLSKFQKNFSKFE